MPSQPVWSSQGGSSSSSSNDDDDDDNDNDNSSNNNNNDNNNDCTERPNLKCLQHPHCAANCLQHVRSNGKGADMCRLRATHWALITCNVPCATRYKGTTQLFSLTKLKSHLFQLYLTG